MIPNAHIANFHAAFERETGHKLQLDGVYLREWAWVEWHKRGFTEADLVLCVRYLRSQIKKELRRPESLLFRNLIQDASHFEEDLNLAKDWARNARKPPTERQQVLAASGRPPEPAKAQERKVDAIAAEILQRGWEQLKKDADL